jgi:hypothetical protein
MKSRKIIIAGCVVLTAFLLIQSCSKAPVIFTQEQRDLTNLARVQVYNVAVGNQRNYVYVDGKAVTGAALVYTNATFSPLFPATANSFVVSPGLRSFVIRDTLITSTQPALAFPENFESNKYYTIFAYDTSSSIKQKTVETNIIFPSDNTARVRFANFVFWKTGTPPNIDIFSKRKNANIFSDIPLTTVTDFIPYESGVSDSLIVRTTGSATALDTAVLSFSSKRSYTLVFRGRYISNGSGGATFPATLSSFTNY